MGYGLGIDTGGTYTDGVIYDFTEEKVIARAKSLTTKEDLSVGITNVLHKLAGDKMQSVQMVSLSTTLATNACVEGKGSRGILLLLGYDEVLLSRLGKEYGLDDRGDIYLFQGSHGQKGQVLEEPDWEAFKQKVLELKDSADAFGIAEYWGIRNPEFEIKAKEIVRNCTDLPTVCAHELSGEINSLRRASTTLLNARLIPLIDSLIKAVKKSLKEQGISAPLMIVRGDGSLMTESFARERPVETLLSGPAASVVGGMKLSGEQDAIIVDIGGTTTDLAVIRRGIAVQAEDGVDVGEWRTGTRAIQVKTVGLGGDSLISFDKGETLTLGPRRATPLSWLAERWPETIDKLQKIHQENKWHSLSLGEFYYQLRKADEKAHLSADEGRIVDALSEGPLSIEELADRTGNRPYFMPLERLESQGWVAKSALTPTDLMHIRGEYTAWNSQAALLGAQILCRRLGLNIEELHNRVFDIAYRRLYSIIAHLLLERSWRKPSLRLQGQAEQMLMMGYESQGDEISCPVQIHLPLIGIGAPTHIFLPGAAAALRTRSVIPTDASVANAVGAITGSILAEEMVVIKPHYETWGIDGYSCHSSKAFFRTESYEKAVEWSKEEAKALVAAKAVDMGAGQIEIIVETSEEAGRVGGEKRGETILLELVVTARGMGKLAQG